jgi:hypothetical protein
MPALQEDCDADAENELETCAVNGSFNAVLSVSCDESWLRDIRTGYQHDEFCKKLSSVNQSMPGV